MRSKMSNGKKQVRRKAVCTLAALTLLTLSLVPTKSWSQVFLEPGDDGGGYRANTTVFVYDFDIVPFMGSSTDEFPSPIGDGLAVLGGLGIAYLVAKRKKK